MKNLMSYAYKLASTTVLAAVAFFAPANDAQASCTTPSGQPKDCGPVAPPVIIPSPSPSTGVVNNNNPTASSTSGAVAGAISGSSSTSGATAGVKTGDIGSTSGATAGIKTGDIGSTSGVKTGDIGSTSSATTGASTSGVKTGDIGSSSSAATGASTSSAKAGDVSVDGSNNSSYSSVNNYKAAAAGATAIATGTMASGACSQSDGGWAIGGQALAWGASISRNSGTSYKTEDVTFTNPDGTTRVEKRNICASDMAAFKLMDAAGAANATKGEKKVAVAIGMEMSPVVDSAVRRVLSNQGPSLGSLFDEEARPASTQVAAAPINTYQTVIVDSTNKAVTTFNCPNGTKLVVDPNGVPVLNKGLPVCQPG